MYDKLWSGTKKFCEVKCSDSICRPEDNLAELIRNWTGKSVKCYLLDFGV